jgi:hypothetical protein
MLDGGQWNGKRLLAEAWVNEATHSTKEQAYGQLWWVLQDGVELDGKRVGGVDVGFGGNGWQGQ